MSLLLIFLLFFFIANDNDMLMEEGMAFTIGECLYEHFIWGVCVRACVLLFMYFKECVILFYH